MCINCSRFLAKYPGVYMLEVVGIHPDISIEYPIQASIFEGNACFTPDSINLDLTIGPMRVANRFHFINPELLVIYYLGDL